MSQPKQDKIMTTVMRLLERAAHPETPAAEAKLCEEKAEALMAQHQIDRMKLNFEQKSRVETAEWNLNVGEAGPEFVGQLVYLMETVLKHCGARVNPRFAYAKNDDGSPTTKVRVYTVVGYPEDMGYAERIWFRVFKDFVSNVNPRWDVTASIADNAYSLIKAGIEWQQIVLMANAAGDPRMPVSEMERNSSFTRGGYNQLVPVKGNRPLGKAINMLRKGYKEACEARDEDATYNRGSRAKQAYRSSFASSFNSTIGRRLREMRTKATETVSDGDKYALAVVDTKEKVDAEFYRLFPEYDPEVQRQKRADEEWRLAVLWASLSPQEQKEILRKQAAEEKAWRARSGRARRNFGSVRDYSDVESQAWSRGNKVANSVNLRDDGQVKKDDRKGLK